MPKIPPIILSNSSTDLGESWLFGQHQKGLGASASPVFQRQRGNDEHRAFGTQSSTPLCLLAIFCHNQSPELSRHAWNARVSVAEGVLLALFAVAHAGVTVHYIQPITSNSSLGNTGQGHDGAQRRPERFLNEVACWEILL